MDPLSIAAGVIAVGQAAVGIHKAIRILHGLSKARVEFGDFLNEISTLHATVYDIEASLIELSQQHGEKLPLMDDTEPMGIRLALSELDDTISELDKLAGRVLEESKGRDGSGFTAYQDSNGRGRS